MADTYTFKSGLKIPRRVPVASGTVIEIGELVKLSSGQAIKMATSTDNLSFLGVAAEAHASTDASGEITILEAHPGTVYEYELDSSTDITFSDDLAWSADKKLTINTTDPIFVAVESKLSATRILCSPLLPSSSTVDRVADAS